MDSRTKNAVSNSTTRMHALAASIYALVGFSLSVIAALLSSLDPRSPSAGKANLSGPVRKPTKPAKPTKPRLQPIPSPSTRPERSRIRSFSDESNSISPALRSGAEKSGETQEDDKSIRRRMLASHRRSRSIPIITLDYFGSVDNLTPKTSEDSIPPLPARRPLTFVISPRPEREQRPATAPDVSSADRPAFKLSNLFTKERPKTPPETKISSPRIQTAQPAFCAAVKPAVAPRRPRSSEGKESSGSKSDGESKPRRSMRRMQSAPTQEKLSMKLDLIFPRSVEKKKSLNLRTQPYEAPYFAPPPVPPLPKLPADAVVPKLSTKKSRSRT